MPETGAARAFAEDLQITTRCRDALAVFRPGELYLSAKALHARMSDQHDVPYSFWSSEAFTTAMNPGGRGVRPGRRGYARHDLLDALNRVSGTWGTQ